MIETRKLSPIQVRCIRLLPNFVVAAIGCFSRPSDLVLDPYMGGGTTVAESMLAGRHTIGGDLNSLAVFVTRVKTSLLTDAVRRGPVGR